MINNRLSKQFLKKGYLISTIENIKNFNRIENRVFLILKKTLKIKKKVSKNNLFNNLHKHLDYKKLNSIRLKIYNDLNSEKWFKNAYYSLASKTIDELVGSEIAIQKSINFSIQMPNDDSSKLEMHADSLSGESKFQIVLWVPLVNTYNTKSMYVFEKNLSIKELSRLKKYKYDGMESIYRKNKMKKKFLKIQKGQFLIFSPNLLHGNVKNLTKETRISMNGRFKNLFSTYSEKNQFGKRIGYFYVPLKIKPATQFAMDFKIPNEF